MKRKISDKEATRRSAQSASDYIDRILREREVGERTGLSRTTRRRLIKAGRFPQPVKLTDHAVGWRESAIADWLASREAA